MAHPHGGSGSRFDAGQTFWQAYTSVGPQGITFLSTTNEEITARQGFAGDKTTATIVFHGQRNRHGSVCEACWGFRVDCNGSRIGQCAQALDAAISSGVRALPLKETARSPHRSTSENCGLEQMVSAEELAGWRRSLLRLLDALDAPPGPQEGLAARISRLSHQGKVPREIASCMRLVAEMRNVTEYEGKRLSATESAAAQNAWLAVEAWAREKKIQIRTAAKIR